MDLLEKLKENVSIRLRDVETRLNELKDNNEVNILLDKMLNMERHFFYSVFHPFFSGFETLEDTEHTISVLINVILDDTEACIKNGKLQFGEGYLNQTDILNFIDQKEKEEIEHINNSYHALDLENVKCFYKRLRTFNEKNLNFLEKEIYKDLWN